MRKVPHAVLFDLDGTLVDTAPDLVHALNCLRSDFQLPPLPLSIMRPIISLGSKAMIKKVLGIEEDHPDFHTLRQRFLSLYEAHLARETALFPHIDHVLTHLETVQIPWGIVTNKLTIHTLPLLKALQLDHRPGCVICGDTLSSAKPDPAPILRACELLQCEPRHCLYVGDAVTDVIASKRAGTISLVALYGYIGEDEHPLSWQADGYLKQPIDLMKWLAVE